MLYSDSSTLLSHTELIFYIKDIINQLPPYIKKYISPSDRYISFSFGDKGFMLQKGGFEHLNSTLVLKALFVKTPALIKVGYYDFIKRDLVISKKISKECQVKLIKNILSYATPNLVLNKNTPYFYRYFLSKEPYNLFFTCNSWTLKVLRDSGISMPLWSPFAYEVVSNFR